MGHQERRGVIARSVREAPSLPTSQQKRREEMQSRRADDKWPATWNPALLSKGFKKKWQEGTFRGIFCSRFPPLLRKLRWVWQWQQRRIKNEFANKSRQEPERRGDGIETPFPENVFLGLWVVSGERTPPFPLPNCTPLSLSSSSSYGATTLPLLASLVPGKEGERKGEERKCFCNGDGSHLFLFPPRTQAKTERKEKNGMKENRGPYLHSIVIFCNNFSHASAASGKT